MASISTCKKMSRSGKVAELLPIIWVIHKKVVPLRLKVQNGFRGRYLVEYISSTTLFDAIAPNDIYAELLKTCYNDRRCQYTLRHLKGN